MKKAFFLLTAMLLTILAVEASPAKPGWYTISQSDGTTLTLRTVGNAFNSAILTTDGLTVDRGSDGDFYYLSSVTGMTAVRAHEPSQRSAAEQTFVAAQRSALEMKYEPYGLPGKRGSLNAVGSNAAADVPALSSFVVKMSDDVLQFAEAPRSVLVVDKDGEPLKAGDPHRFFEASWMHKYNGKYYFSYSTGDSHMLCYGIGDNPYGPFTYQGVILDPVVGWTTHHSIVEYKGEWFLFYHDCVPSNDVTHLRSLKVQRLFYNEDGTIQKVVNE